jgi:hypothetical protein
MAASGNGVRLKQVDGQGRVIELTLHETALEHEVVEGGAVGPGAQVLLGDRWVPLADYPGAPWLDTLARRAVAAAEGGDTAGAGRFADRLLGYAGDSGGEAVRIALFLEGHFCLCLGKCREAADLLGRAAYPPSSFSPAAHSNRGVAWVRLQNPAAALEEFEWALAEDGTFLVASLCLRNLAAALEAEKAPPVAGEPSWADVRRREAERLRQASEGQLRALLDPRARFPGYPFWHVLGPGPYVPAVSAGLPRSPEGQPAALRLLAEANQALGDGQYRRAHVLSRAAPAFSPSVKPAADRLTAAAAAKIEEGRLLAVAERTIARLGAFLDNLRGLTLDDLDAARESLALAAPLLREADLRGLYRDRVEQVIAGALAGAEGGRRSRLLTIAHRYARSESADAYLRAAACCLAHQGLGLFWSAAQGGDLDGAAAALGTAARFLDGAEDLREERAVLEQLRLHQARALPG